MSIEKELREIITKMSEKDVSKLGVDDIIKDKTTIDSLDMVESMMAIEDHFEIELDDREMGQVRTLQDLIGRIKEGLERKKNGQTLTKPKSNYKYTKTVG